MKRTTVYVLSALLLSPLLMGAAPVPAAPTAHIADEPPASVPPSAMPGCGAPGTKGGWVLRDFNAIAAKEDSGTLVVRPRSFRLGEPCYSGGKIVVPTLATELPISDVAPPLGPGGALGNCTTYAIPGGTTEWARLATWSMQATCNEVRLYHRLFNETEAQAKHSTTLKVAVTSTAVNKTTLTVTATRTANWNSSYGPYPGANGGGVFWYKNCYTSAGVLSSSTGASWGTIVPGTPKVLAETCPTGQRIQILASSGGATGTQWAYGIISTEGAAWSPIPNIGGKVSSHATIGDNAALGSDAGGFECTTTRGGTPFIIPINSRYTYDAGPETAYDLTLPIVNGTEYTWTRTDNLVLASGATETTCPFLVRAFVSVCTWQIDGSTGYSCSNVEWKWSQMKRGYDYAEGTPEEGLCVAGNYWQGCNDILYPPIIDGTDFNQVCGDPPPMEWLNFNWLPSVIGYYSGCLFVPANGWDSQGLIADRWESSAVSDLGSVFSSLATSMQFSESCGVLISAPIHGNPVTIDTCTWTWAGLIHALLTVTLWLWFGIWAVNFIASSLIGVVNKKTPSPLGEGVRFE